MELILKTLEKELSPYAGLYNKEMPEKNQVVDFGNPQNLCVVIGNTKKIWIPFLDDLSKQSEIPQNPIDVYTKKAIENVLKTITTEYHIHYTYDYSHIVSMQKLSYLSGMCYLSPKTHLCIHPKYGSWIALRAAIVFNCIYDKEPPVLMAPVCPECEIKQGEMLDEILKNKETNIKKAEVAQKWIDFRCVCDVGKEYKYCDNQLMYHYTKDIKYIQSALNDYINSKK